MFLGIDLGTTELKVLLLASDGHVVGTARYPLEISRPKSRWSEQDPEDWWRATQIALATLRTNYPDAFGGIHAIGLSGQMHGAVLLDANDRPSAFRLPCRPGARSRTAVSLAISSASRAPPGY